MKVVQGRNRGRRIICGNGHGRTFSKKVPAGERTPAAKAMATQLVVPLTQNRPNTMGRLSRDSGIQFDQSTDVRFSGELEVLDAMSKPFHGGVAEESKGVHS